MHTRLRFYSGYASYNLQDAQCAKLAFITGKPPTAVKIVYRFFRCRRIIEALSIRVFQKVYGGVRKIKVAGAL
jgi:hypothetical protein